MSKIWMRLFSIAILFIFLVGALPSPGVQANSLQTSSSSTNRTNQAKDHAQTAIPEGFQVVSSTETSLVLDLYLPAYQLNQVLDQDRSCQTLNIAGYSRGDTPGKPDLPSAGVLIGIPIDATPTIQIQAQETVEIPGLYHLCPAASPLTQQDSSGMVEAKGETLTENLEAYAQNEFTPSRPVEINTAGMIRSQAVARLRFLPFRYNPASGELQVTRHVRIEINLGIDLAKNATANTIDEGPFETVLAQSLINYEQARFWRSGKQSAVKNQSLSIESLTLDQPSYKILVNQDGIYQVSYAALQSAGLAMSTLNTLDPRTFRIFNQGIEIPIYLSSGNNSLFSASDYLLFYGQKITTRYTNTNVYWLSWGSSSGLRMPSLDGAVSGGGSPLGLYKTTLHLEEDHTYWNVTPSGPQNDHWYWSYLNGYSGPVSQTFSFHIENLAAGSPAVSVRGLLKGYNAVPQHHTRIFLNGNLIEDRTWPSTSEHAFSIDVPPSDLVVGNNTLTVECPFDNGITRDQLLINWFEIDYDHTFIAENDLLAFNANQSEPTVIQVDNFSKGTMSIFDVTDPLAPIQILNGTIEPNGASYRVTFQSQAIGVHRYLALTPSRWLTPLAISQDTPSDLMNTANSADYIIISHADFLAAIQPLASYRASQGLRTQVVDVQDIYDEFNGGVFDPQAIQQFLSYAYYNWKAPAPAYVLLVGDGHYDFKNNLGTSGPVYIPPYLGEFDPWIGETASDNRFVTINGDDILPDMFIGRLPANSAIETTAMVDKILAYEQNPASGGWNSRVNYVADDADSGGNFPVLSDSIANLLPEGYQADKIYYGSTHPTVSGAQTAIINAINDGRLMVNFTGHAAIGFWASEQLFGVSSIASLSNGGKYPFFVPMTCQEGYFIYPDQRYPALAEALVRASAKGAIASFSATGFGLSSGHDFLARGLYQSLFSDNIIQLGRATTLAKYYLYANSTGFQDLIDTYMLFGDPATRLKTNPTAVTLASFTGQALPRKNDLKWETSNETWAVGFNIYRSTSADGSRQKLNPNLILARNPGQVFGGAYLFEDSVNPGDRYFYWLEQVQITGNMLTGPISLNSGYWINLPVVIR